MSAYIEGQTQRQYLVCHCNYVNTCCFTILNNYFMAKQQALSQILVGHDVHICEREYYSNQHVPLEILTTCTIRFTQAYSTCALPAHKLQTTPITHLLLVGRQLITMLKKINLFIIQNKLHTFRINAVKPDACLPNIMSRYTKESEIS